MRTPEDGPLWHAIQGDVAQLEVGVARVQTVIAAFALLIALYFSVLVQSPIGPPLAGFAILVFCWFSLAHAGMRRGFGVGFFMWVNPLVEMLIPGYVLLILARLEGPEYALGSWVPPQMFALFIAASVLRLRVGVPAVMGAVGAVEYGLVYWVELQPAMPVDAALWAQPDVQLVRMFTVVAIGIAGSMAVIAFRNLVQRAGATVRSRDLFGKYQMGPQIASGGMGSVHRATYAPEGGFRRAVAIKRIHPHLAENPAFLERFRHEAELCSRLAHPNIVAVLDFGVADNAWFFAMEFIDGVTLKDVLWLRRKREEPLRPALVCWILRQVLDGLQYAHAGAVDAQGELLHVVHRDLSPHNVLLDRSGVVKISDFGVARALKDAHDLNTANLAGKPAYMAPEQLRKRGIDERSDLFTVGILAWEALTNRRLFFRDNEAATLLAVLEDEVPPPSQVRSEVGPHWDRFCVRALTREPEKRFQTALGMVTALAAIQEVEGQVGPDQVSALVAEVRGAKGSSEPPRSGRS